MNSERSGHGRPARHRSRLRGDSHDGSSCTSATWSTDLFAPGEVRGVYTHEDRMVVAGAMPGDGLLRIPAWDAVGTPDHLTRRELGVVNLGEAGDVVVDGTAHKLGTLDGLYAGRGADVVLTGEGGLLLPRLRAGATSPTPPRRSAATRWSRCPSARTSWPAAATLYRYVWGGGAPVLPAPVRRHRRRGGLGLEHDAAAPARPPYGDLPLHRPPPGDRVVHLMGRPGATRHLLVADRQAVINPAWSVHAGAGTAPYAFVWAMAGENTDYGDLTPVALDQL